MTEKRNQPAYRRAGYVKFLDHFLYSLISFQSGFLLAHKNNFEIFINFYIQNKSKVYFCAG